MKSVVIGILSSALALAAFMTRPTEADFIDYISDALPDDRRSLPEKILHVPSRADKLLSSLVFKDRYLWVQVEDLDGKVLFTGFFDHWFDRAGGTPQKQLPRREEKTERIRTAGAT